MDIKVKCASCGGTYEVSTKTRRRVVYRCDKCGRELPVRKHPKQESITANS